MTIDERFERIEHVTAGLAEERRKDREENHQLWRQTQRHIDELSIKIVEMQGVDQRLAQRIEQLAEESRAEDKRLAARIDALGERIDKVVSAIGTFVASVSKSQRD